MAMHMHLGIKLLAIVMHLPEYRHTPFGFSQFKVIETKKPCQASLVGNHEYFR
jgi:hypothetical protein